MVAAKPKKSSLTWNDVKCKMADFDRAGLVGVLQALYAASRDNRAFLHARPASDHLRGQWQAIHRGGSAIARRMLRNNATASMLFVFTLLREPVRNLAGSTCTMI
jgi:hypothetical protein